MEEARSTEDNSVEQIHSSEMDSANSESSPRRTEKNPKIKRFLEKFGSTSSLNLEEITVQSPKSVSPREKGYVAQKFENAIAEKAKNSAPSHKRSSTVPDIIYRLNTERLDASGRGVIDTTAPFESVRQAVTKFGGLVGKVQQSLTLEKQRGVQLELRKVQEEITKHKKYFNAASSSKDEVLKDLETTKRIVDELKWSVERSVTQEAHAKQDSVLAELRAQEIKNGIGAKDSTAIKKQLEVEHERHDKAVVALTAVKQETESARLDYEAVIQDMDLKMSNAEACSAALEQIMKNVEHLTMDLITTKIMLEAANTVFSNIEESKASAALALEEDKRNFEKEIEPLKTELEQLNQQVQFTVDLKSKLDEACTLLSNLKSELSAYVEAKLNGEGAITDEERIMKADESELNPWELLCRTRWELKRTTDAIENAKDNIDSLRIEVSSLSSELEKEKESVASMRHKEGMTSESVLSLQVELEKTNTELELAQKRERDSREKMEGVSKQVEMATKELEQAKSAANSAHKELTKAKEETEYAKVTIKAVDTKLNATLLEIEAAKASVELATSECKALEESENVTIDSPKVVTLSLEEYHQLNQRVEEAEELSNRRVNSATEQIKAVMESECLNLSKLEECNKKIEVRKEELQAANERAKEAEEMKEALEQELQELIAKHEMQSKACVEATDMADNKAMTEPMSTSSDRDDTSSEVSSTTSPKTVLKQAPVPIPAIVPHRKKLSMFHCGAFGIRKKSHSSKKH